MIDQENQQIIDEVGSIESKPGLRTQILAISTRLFVTYGFNGVSMREIAAEAGISKAGLYYHFKDKKDLFLAILNHHLDDMQNILVDCKKSGKDTHTRLRCLAELIFANPPEQRAIIRLGTHEMMSLDQKTRSAFDQVYHQKFIGLIEGIIEEGIQNGEIRPFNVHLITWTFLGMLYPFFILNRQMNPEEIEEIINTTLKIFFEGIKTAS